MKDQNKKEKDEFVIGKHEPVFTISVVSRLLKIPIWTLKKFDKEKLVSPTQYKGSGNLYSRFNLDKLKHFWNLMNLKGVKFPGLKIIKQMEDERDKKGGR